MDIILNILFYLLFKSKIYYSVAASHMEKVYITVKLVISIPQEKSGHLDLGVVYFFKWKMCAGMFVNV